MWRWSWRTTLGERWFHLPGSLLNLTWKRKRNSHSHSDKPQSWLTSAFKVIVVLFHTYWYGAVKTPAAAFQEEWSSLQPQLAVPALPRWPAEMPGWLRFAGISPADACWTNRAARSLQAGLLVMLNFLAKTQWDTHLLSLDSNSRLSMRLATVCKEKNVKLKKHKKNRGRNLCEVDRTAYVHGFTL